MFGGCLPGGTEFSGGGGIDIRTSLMTNEKSGVSLFGRLGIIKKFQSLKVRWYLQYKLLLEHLKNDDFVRLLHTCTHPTGFVIVSYSPTGPHYQCHGGHSAPAPYTSTRFHSGSLYIGTALRVDPLVRGRYRWFIMPLL